MRQFSLTCSCAFLLLANATGTAHAKSQEVETTGLGVLEGGDEATARARALQQALSLAVAQVAGQWVESRFEATQSEQTKNQKTTFLSRVEESTKADVKGFVETYRIQSEGKQGTSYRVTVLAVVNTRKLDDVFGALQDALDKQKYRALVVARESDVTATATPISGQTAAFVENELSRAGLQLASHPSPSLTADVLTLADNEGRSANADVVVLLEAKYKNLGVIGPGAQFEALVGQTRVELELTLRSALVKERRVLSSKPVSMTSVGTTYDRAIARMLAGQGNNAIRQATQDFFEKLLKELEQAPKASAQVAAKPSPLRLVIEKVTSFKKQGRPLIELIGKASGVQQVVQKNFVGAVLELSVEFSGDVNTLEQVIFDQCDKKRFCSSIDRKRASASELVLSL